jgi:hypothetical protein
MADEPKRTEKLSVAIYWPGEGYGHLRPVETMARASGVARRLIADGYGLASKSAKKNEIHIIRIVREVTVWSDDDPVG